MKSGKQWGWALPGLLLAAACMAQPQASSSAVSKQLANVRQEVKSQQAQAHDLEQQVREAKQRNHADQASLAQRDKEIARLKAELAKKQAKAAAPTGKSRGKGH